MRAGGGKPFCAGYRAIAPVSGCSREGWTVRGIRLRGEADGPGAMAALPGNSGFFFGQHVSQGMDTGIRRIARLPGQGLETEPETVIFPENMAGKGNEGGMPG